MICDYSGIKLEVWGASGFHLVEHVLHKFNSEILSAALLYSTAPTLFAACHSASLSHLPLFLYYIRKARNKT